MIPKGTACRFFSVSYTHLDAKNAAVESALNSVKNNTAVLEPAEGLKEAVNVKLPEGYKGVSRVDSELKDMEMIAEMADGKLVVLSLIHIFFGSTRK